MKKNLNYQLVGFALLCPFLLIAQADQSSKKEKKDDTSTAKQSTIANNITFLNAANFDFSDNFTGSYLGKLNIYAPDLRKTPFGFIAGIMRIKFNYKDSSNSPLYFENKLIHPLDSVLPRAKYLRQLNRYVSTRSNTVWSFYIQPLIRLIPIPVAKKKFLTNTVAPNGVYFHLHGELLVNKVNITTNIENIQQDTALMDTSKHLYYVPYQRNPLIFDKTYLNGYFGLGLTVVVNPFENGNSRFFFQGTLGKTTNYPNWASQDISSTTVNVIPTRSGTTILQPRLSQESRGFYLVRAEFAQLLSNNSQIAIGTEIRGLFPRYDPLYAAYIGLNLNLDALVKVISDKGSSSTDGVQAKGN